VGVQPILTLTDRGLYCPAADLYIDPWKPVDRAVITHAHSDHARRGMGEYLCAQPGEEILRLRLDSDAKVQSLPFGESLHVRGVRLSLHPAGHVLGSAQVRLEAQGHVAVVSGDYKTEADRTCEAFELVRCHLFVTESTFGLPIYRWQESSLVFEEIDAWWKENQARGRASLLMGYALGKGQRALGGLRDETGPIFLHGAMQALTEAYRRQGIKLPETHLISSVGKDYDWSRAMIVAPPSAQGTPWVRRFGEHSTAFMSGWMAIRGTRRRRAVDRGFVLSDHVDWPSLLSTVKATGAEEVWVTHGYTDVVVRYLKEQGLDAKALETLFVGEGDALESDPVEVQEDSEP